eukprot:TRINITY_DN28154_c0_g1_i1.p1 TRINITY_DN28154_c0_g1~~TRINITY_DN28154_c0_g1_i1.p1  ORF type:complete len:309 (-),score=47.46 TRINITY_DN28154_c0_g1_i1:183-1109(-)
MGFDFDDDDLDDYLESVFRGFMGSFRSSDPPVTKPFYFTHAEYTAGDPFSFASAFFSIVPIFAVVAFAAIVVSHRSGHALYLVFVSIFTEVAGSILKKTIGAPRPNRSLGSGTHGMPSTHAMLAAALSVHFFFVVFSLRSFLPGLSGARRMLLSSAAFAVAALVCLSRWYLGYHSVLQITVGVGLGVLCGWASAAVLLLFPPAHRAFDCLASAVVSAVMGPAGRWVDLNTLPAGLAAEAEETSAAWRRDAASLSADDHAHGTAETRHSGDSAAPASKRRRSGANTYRGDCDGNTTPVVRQRRGAPLDE